MELREFVRQRLAELPTQETTESPSAEYDPIRIGNQVREELGYHVRESTYSQLLFEQMVSLYGNGFVDIRGKKYLFSILDVNETIESISTRTVDGDPLGRRGSRLAGLNLLHTHQSRTYGINFNLLRYFDKTYPNEISVQSRLLEIQRAKSLTEIASIEILVRTIVMESFNSPDKTGQWLIYKRTQRGFHFVALYIHDKEDKRDEILYAWIKDHLDP